MKVIFILALLSFSLSPSFAQNKANIIESNNQFTFDIYQKLKKPGKNIIFSPVSITSAIAMTYVGAKNNTFSEISNTFYFNSDIDEFSKDYLNLSKPY